MEYMSLLLRDLEKFEEGKAEGRAEGIAEALVGLVKDGIISVKIAAERAGMDVPSFELLMKKH